MVMAIDRVHFDRYIVQTRVVMSYEEDGVHGNDNLSFFQSTCPFHGSSPFYNAALSLSSCSGFAFDRTHPYFVAVSTSFIYREDHGILNMMNQSSAESKWQWSIFYCPLRSSKIGLLLQMVLLLVLLYSLGREWERGIRGGSVGRSTILF